MGKKYTIGVLTGGGDVPGLNPCIKTLTYRGVDEGFRVLGIRRGWAGLLEFNPEEKETYDQCFIELDKQKTRTIDRQGGTFLHTSRTNPSAVKPGSCPEFLKDKLDDNSDVTDFTEHIIRNLEHVGIDAVVPIGGDDTLSFAERLHRENFPVNAIPKTMDNDVYGTDYCIGFSTAVTRSVDFINNLRTVVGSHERIGVVELFGRYCGETALVSGYLTGADRCIISEVPFDMGKLAEMIMRDKHANPSNYAMVVISEGARTQGGEMVTQSGRVDAYGHRKLGGIGSITGEELKRITGSGIVFQQLSYLMRSGSPDSLDVMIAVNYAHMAIDLFLKEITGRMMSLRKGIYTDVPLSILSTGQKRVDVREMYDMDEYRPKIMNIAGKPMFLY
jgi:ATP-dependent phosphofructokinase / diphosphate-dependent phosphofructokinase